MVVALPGEDNKDLKCLLTSTHKFYKLFINNLLANGCEEDE